MPRADAFAPWLPALLVLILSAVAVAVVVAPPAVARAKRRRMTAIALLGALAVGATLWQARSGADQIARLTRENQSSELTARVKSLEDQISKLKESTRNRTLSADTTAKLADYLRHFGSHSVVVSCVPNDIEAYRYATQITDVLKAANWDARGPETTTIFGDVRAMGINVYDNGGHDPDTTKILLDGLAKFAIPYQSRVPPSEALLDSETVELFIGTRPTDPPKPEAARTAR
jgi:cell division protein FtsB